MLGDGGGGGGGGAGLGLDFSAVIQAAVVGLVLFSAAVVAVRRAASRYFVVDAAGFAASYDDHHHHHHSPPAYPMSPKGSQLERGPAGGEASGPCAACGVVTSKKCSRCKRVRYWCVSSSPVPSWYCLVMGMALHVILRSCRIPSGICRFCFVIWWLVRGIVPGYWYWPSPGVPESNFHNFGLVSCKIGVSG